MIGFMHATHTGSTKILIDPSAVFVTLWLCFFFHLYQDLLRKKAGASLWFLPFRRLEDSFRRILKAAQHSACFEIQEAGWLDKYSLHIAVPEWPRLPSLSALCALTHWYPCTFTTSLMDAMESVKRKRKTERLVAHEAEGTCVELGPKWNVKYCHMLQPTVTQRHDGTKIPGTNSSPHFPQSPLFSQLLSYPLHHLSHCPNGHQFKRCTMHWGIKFWSPLCSVITIINLQNPINSTVCLPSVFEWLWRSRRALASGTQNWWKVFHSWQTKCRRIMGGREGEKHTKNNG